MIRGKVDFSSDFFYNIIRNVERKDNMKKTEFETLEELQRVYPIGSIFSTSIEKERWYCPSEKDIKAAISMWGEENVTILNEDTIVVTKKFNTYVQGYLFDGEYWRPAGNGWDGWYELEEEEEEGDEI